MSDVLGRGGVDFESGWLLFHATVVCTTFFFYVKGVSDVQLLWEHLCLLFKWAQWT